MLTRMVSSVASDFGFLCCEVCSSDSQSFGAKGWKSERLLSARWPLPDRPGRLPGMPSQKVTDQATTVQKGVVRRVTGQPTSQGACHDYYRTQNLITNCCHPCRVEEKTSAKQTCFGNLRDLFSLVVCLKEHEAFPLNSSQKRSAQAGFTHHKTS